MRSFQLTLAAEEDLLEIELYLTERSEMATDTFLGDIEAACRLLGEHPGVGRHRDELRAGVMSFPVGSYVVFYTAEDQAVVILRILHGHRDIPSVF